MYLMQKWILVFKASASYLQSLFLFSLSHSLSSPLSHCPRSYKYTHTHSLDHTLFLLLSLKVPLSSSHLPFSSLFHSLNFSQSSSLVVQLISFRTPSIIINAKKFAALISLRLKQKQNFWLVPVFFHFNSIFCNFRKNFDDLIGQKLIFWGFHQILRMSFFNFFCVIIFRRNDGVASTA